MYFFLFNRNTFQEVQDNSAQIWKYHRYGLILEYAARPALVPPFILLVHISVFVKWLFRCVCCKDQEEEQAAGLRKFYAQL